MLTSPLRRAVETCELAGLEEQAQIQDDLREWDYGDYEGITTAEIHGRRPGWSLWRDGCPNGETAADVGARADRVIAGSALPTATRSPSVTATCCACSPLAGSGFRPRMAPCSRLAPER